MGDRQDDGADEDGGHTPKVDLPIRPVHLAALFGQHGQPAGQQGHKTSYNVEDQCDTQK